MWRYVRRLEHVVYVKRLHNSETKLLNRKPTETDGQAGDRRIDRAQ